MLEASHIFRPPNIRGNTLEEGRQRSASAGSAPVTPPERFSPKRNTITLTSSPAKPRLNPGPAGGTELPQARLVGSPDNSVVFMDFISRQVAIQMLSPRQTNRYCSASKFESLHFETTSGIKIWSREIDSQIQVFLRSC